MQLDFIPDTDTALDFIPDEEQFRQYDLPESLKPSLDEQQWAANNEYQNALAQFSTEVSPIDLTKTKEPLLPTSEDIGAALEGLKTGAVSLGGDIAAAMSLFKKPEGYQPGILPPSPATIAQAVKENIPFAQQASGNIYAGLTGQELPIDVQIAEAAREGGVNEAALAKFAEAGMGMAPLVATGALPSWAHRLLSAGFTVDMLRNLPELSKRWAEEENKPPEEQNPELLADLRAGMASTALFAPLTGAATVRPKPITTGERYARPIEETTEVHGNVRAQPVEGLREVPVEGRGERVQPSPEEVAKAAQVSLSPEHHPIVDEAIRASPESVELVQTLHDEANTPFDTGRIATITPDGKVQINASRLNRWLSRMPADQRPEAMKSLVAEESNHAEVYKAMTPAEREEFWHDLTGAERALHLKRYTGHWTLDAARRAGIELSPEQLGYEALNSFQMRMSRMTLREVAEVARREQWKIKTLDNLAHVIFNVRKKLGTRASQRQLAHLAKLQTNINAARVALGGAATYPAATMKEWEEANGKKYRPEDYTDKDISLTVFKPPGMEGYVQVDSNKGGVNEWSSNLDSVKSHGFDVPTKAEVLQNIPGGQYTLEQVKQMLSGEPQKFPAALAREAKSKVLRDEEGNVLDRAFAWESQRDLDYKLQKWQDRTGKTLKWEEAYPAVQGPAALARQTKERVLRDREGRVLDRAFAYESPEQLDYKLDKWKERTGQEDLKWEEPPPFRLPGAPAAREKGRIPREHPELELTRGEAFARPTAEQMGAERGKTITPELVSESVGRVLSEQGRPSFQKFVERIRGQFGDVKPGQLRDEFRDQTWKHLMAAPGEEIRRLAKAMNVTKGIRMEDASGDVLDIADPPTGYLERLPEGELGLELERFPSTFNASQRRRLRAIRAIATKLFSEAEQGRKSLTRKEITPEDVGSPRRAAEPAYVSIGTQDIRNPDVLARRITSDARSFGDSVSVTHRVTALLDNRTGKVELVSTYFDPRRGAVLLDPHAPKGEHSRLSSIIHRYRPVASILLDEPVQNFRQTFNNLADFNETIGRSAHETSVANEYAIVGAGESIGPPEGGWEPTSGREMGILGKEQRGIIQTLRVRPVTSEEAGAIRAGILAEAGKFDSPEDVKLMLASFKERQNRLALSGLRKISRRLQRENPYMAISDLIDLMANRLYEIQKTATTPEDFNARTMALGPAPRGEAPWFTPAKAPTEKLTGARELTMPARVPPTVTRPEQLAPAERARVESQKQQGGLQTAAEQEAARRSEQEARKKALAYAQRSRGRPPEQSKYLKIWMELSRLQRESEAGREQGPAALEKRRAQTADLWTKLKDEIGAYMGRRESKGMIPAWRDSADATAVIDSRYAGNEVRLETTNPMELAAAKVLIASKGDPSLVDDYLQFCQLGKDQATALMRESDPRSKRMGRKWYQAAQKLEQEVIYARDHWNTMSLRRAADAVYRELNKEYDFETENGIDITKKDMYLPGRYDAEFFNDNFVSFGEQRILGRNFRKPKTFENYYEAIANGPFIPKTYDISKLVEHRVRQGRLEVNKRLWVERLKNTIDPVSGMPIVLEPKIVKGKEVSPSPEYEGFRAGVTGNLVFVRRGYKPLLRAMTATSAIRESPVGLAALRLTQLIKHGVLLIFDTFHPGRLGQYDMAALGAKSGYRGGYSALEYRADQMDRAVEAGLISQKQADWARGRVEVTLPNGNRTTMTRREILDFAIAQGLNVGRIQDALYMDLVRSWPIVGSLNRWTFDRMTRGMMAEMAVREFENYNKSYPHIPMQRMMRDVVRDTNMYFGSLGRQGVIKNPTFQDIAQLVFLAPQWVEGLVQKEARFYGRTALAPLRLAQRKPVYGALGKAMGRGLAAYFVLTQVLNLITRGQPTWMNKEENHKMDAWIPIGGEDGLWLSPMSVFAEITHDVIRYNETKPNTWEAIRQIGSNKLGPWGRLGMVLATRETPWGQRLTTTGAVLKEAAKQVAPVPISLGAHARALGHLAAPGIISPPRRGQVPRQLFASAGIKVQPSDTAGRQLGQLADKFMEAEGLKKTTGWMTIQTEEPSYSRLRSALRNDDIKEAKHQLEELLKSHSLVDIVDAMDQWSGRGFTGSDVAEQAFLNTLDDDQLETYSKAVIDKLALREKFLEFVASQ